MPRVYNASGSQLPNTRRTVVKPLGRKKSGGLKPRTSNPTMLDVIAAQQGGQAQSERFGAESAFGAERAREKFQGGEAALDRAAQDRRSLLNSVTQMIVRGERVPASMMAQLEGGQGQGGPERPPPAYASALPNTNVTFANRHGERPTGPAPLTRQQQTQQGMGIRVGTPDYMADVRAKNIELYRNMALRDDAMRARQAAEDAAGQTPTVPMQLPGGDIYQHPSRGVLTPEQQAQFTQANQFMTQPTTVQPTPQQQLPTRIQPYSQGDAASINRDTASMGLQGRVQSGPPMMVNGQIAPNFVQSAAQPTQVQPGAADFAGRTEAAQQHRQAAATRPDPFNLATQPQGQPAATAPVQRPSTQPPIPPGYAGPPLGAVQQGVPAQPGGPPDTTSMSRSEFERYIAGREDARQQQVTEATLGQTTEQTGLAATQQMKDDAARQAPSILSAGTDLGKQTWTSGNDVASMRRLQSDVDNYIAQGKTPEEQKIRAQELLSNPEFKQAMVDATQVDMTQPLGLASSVFFGGPTALLAARSSRKKIINYRETADQILSRLNQAAQSGQ